MNLIWGIFLTVLSLLGWLGQVVNALAPALAQRWGLNERESDVDSTFFADTRGEAIWDALIIWTMPVAGVLLIVDSPLWAYFGLVGGGSYVYFVGRGIAVRLVMRRRGIRIGPPEAVRLYFGLFGLFGLIAVVTIVMAAAALAPS
ncbi:MAG: hypothetical protein HY675_18035 [Chloroflexi bacterium]|nr:hypothetical protein [Chloroflexota bacterium]